MIQSPGKFEEEKLYVPYFWNRFLDDKTVPAVRTDGRIQFTVTDTDRTQFPELKKRKAVTLVETDDGCVCEVP